MLSYTVFLFYCVSIICSSKRMAVKNKRPSRYLIVQSDIGSQYRCNNYYKSIKKRKFRSWVLKRVNRAMLKKPRLLMLGKVLPNLFVLIKV